MVHAECLAVSAVKKQVSCQWDEDISVKEIQETPNTQEEHILHSEDKCNGSDGETKECANANTTSSTLVTRAAGAVTVTISTRSTISSLRIRLQTLADV